VPVQVSLRREDFTAVTEKFFGRLGGSNIQMDALVLWKVAVTLERFAADVATERRLAPETLDILNEILCISNQTRY